MERARECGCVRVCVHTHLHNMYFCICLYICQVSVHVTPPLLIQHHGIYSSFISLFMFMTPSSDGEKSGSCYSKYVYLLDQSLCVSTISHYQHLLPHADTSVTQCWALMPYARQCPPRVPFSLCSGFSWQRHPLGPQTSPSHTTDALLTCSSSDILCCAALTHSSFDGTIVLSTPHPSLGTRMSSSLSPT